MFVELGKTMERARVSIDENSCERVAKYGEQLIPMVPKVAVEDLIDRIEHQIKQAEEQMLRIAIGSKTK